VLVFRAYYVELLRRWLVRQFRLLFIAFCCAIGFAEAQEPSSLAPGVRAFVKEDAPVIALVHVRVIDGTGAAPRADQTLVIRSGKISTMGDAATAKIPEGA
jgi:hypothetical protein